MKKLYYLLICIISLSLINVNANNAYITYQAHGQDYGWQKPVSEYQLAGTTGQYRRMEGLKINLVSSIPGNIEYSAHVADYGWLPYVKNGALAGTTGQYRRMEAIRIRLTGEIANYYDVEYCVHGQDYGWQKCVKNDAVGGTTGQWRRMEGIKIRLIQKATPINIKYKTYLENSWQLYVQNGTLSGTAGENKPLEALAITLDNPKGEPGEISYSVYKNDSWSEYYPDNTEVFAGETGIEAIKVRLTGELANNYDIFYKVYSPKFGWLDWTKNDDIAGTIGYHKGIEGFRVKLVSKKNPDITVGKHPYRELSNRVNYVTHVADKQWLSYVSEDEPSGMEGKRIEALKIKLDSGLSGNIVYQSYVVNEGWQNEVSNDAMSGTTGKWRGIEAIKIRLTGDVSNEYDVYYKTYVPGAKWLGWAKNGEIAGSIGNDETLEQIQIKLVKKGDDPEINSLPALIKGSFKNQSGGTYYYNYYNKLASGFKYIDGRKYYFDDVGKQVSNNAKKVVDVSSYQKDINWQVISDRKDIDAAIIRVGWGKSYTDPCGMDSYFEKNLAGVKKYNIPYSIYIYGYAKVDYAAEAEAQCVIDAMNKYNIPKNTFVYYDAEISTIPLSTYEVVIPKFVNKMHANGYNNVGVYCNLYALSTTYLNSDKIKSYPIWVAQYYKKCQYTGSYIGWQYTSSGYVEGINGDVDLSMFK